MDRGIQSEEEYEYQRLKLEYNKGSDKADPFARTRSNEFEAIDELVDEENAETSRK